MEDLELEKVCRLCLTLHENLQLAKEVGATDQLLDCALVELPSHSLICQFCKTEISKWFAFKRQVLKSLEVASYIEKHRKSFENSDAVIEECFIKTEVEEEIDVKPDITQINDLTNEEDCGEPALPQHGDQRQCDLSNKTFISKVGLRWHKKLHSALEVDLTESTEPFTCPYCPLAYEKELALKEHIKLGHQRLLKHGDNYAVIEDYRIKTEIKEEIDIKPDIIQIDDLINELNPEPDKEPESTIEKTWFCGSCDKTLYTLRGFKNHNKKFHPPEEDYEEPSSPSDDKHQCDLCHKTFISNVGMMWHKKLHSALKLDTDTTEGALVFSCPYCPMSYEKKQSLIDHMKWKHQRMLKRSNQSSICDFCGKYCKSKSEFTAHIKTHKGEKQFKCAVCSRSFVNKQNLVYHRSVHLDMECLFSCALCGRRFRKNSYLRRHKATHERPYKCDLCNKTFSRNYALKKHMETHCVNF